MWADKGSIRPAEEFQDRERAMPEWLSSRLPEGWNGWHLAALGLVVGVVSAVVSGLVVAFVIARLPADYFINPQSRRGYQFRHPILRVLLVLIRNLVGYFLIGLGVILSLPGVPGQGLLTILMGVMLIDFPGKFRLEQWLISRPAVLDVVNRVRSKIGRQPLLLETQTQECDAEDRPTLRTESQANPTIASHPSCPSSGDS